MSGHSKWSQIKHKKEASDQKRGQLFSQLSRLIALATRQGFDPNLNPDLKNAIDKARAANMPKENIERAIKKGQNKDAALLAELTIEALGPAGLNIILLAITDNRNRTLAEIKKILAAHEAKIGQPGSVSWAFDRQNQKFIPKYPLIITTPEAREKTEKLLIALKDQEDILEIYTNLNHY